MAYENFHKNMLVIIPLTTVAFSKIEFFLKKFQISITILSRIKDNLDLLFNFSDKKTSFLQKSLILLYFCLLWSRPYQWTGFYIMSRKMDMAAVNIKL